MQTKIIVIRILLAYCLFNNLMAQTPTFQWAKAFTGNAYYGSGTAVAVDASGNVYTTGYFSGTVDFDPGPGTSTMVASSSMGVTDVFISKLDAAGNFVWCKSLYGGSEDYGTQIKIDVFGNVVVVGCFSGVVDFDPGPATYTLSSGNSGSHFVLKLNSAGNFVWAATIDNTSLGSADGLALDIDASANIYVGGNFAHTVDFDPGPGASTYTASPGNIGLFITKFSSFGVHLWSRAMQPTQSTLSGLTSLNSLVLDGSGNIYATGILSGAIDFDPGPGTFTLSSGGAADLFAVKLDLSGNFLWAVASDAAANSEAKGVSITADALGNTFITGVFTSTVDFNPGVGTFNLSSNGDTDVFVLKLNTSGNFVWAVSVGGTCNDRGWDIASNAAGEVYVSTHFCGTTDFDPGAGVFNATAQGLEIGLLKLDPNGNFVSVVQMGGSGSTVSQNVTLDLAGNIFLSGYFNGLSDFDPGQGIFNLNANGQEEIFVVKLNAPLTGITENLSGMVSRIYPNPLRHLATVEAFHTFTRAELTIYNVAGEKVLTNHAFHADKIHVNCEELPSGVYFYKFVADESIQSSGKFLVAD